MGCPADPTTTESVEGVRQLLRYTNDDAEVEATTIYTVGKEGFDGFLCVIRKYVSEPLGIEVPNNTL
jgi:hypothetical protein